MISKSIIVAILLATVNFTASAVFSPKEFSSPLLPVPELQQEPQINDFNNVESWSGSVKVFGFKNLKSGMPARFDTQVWLGRYKKAFYLRFRCFAPRGTKPLSNIKRRDGKLWKEDSVEIYLASVNAVHDSDYYQFGISAANTRLDTFQQSFKWNGKWSSKTKILSDGWVAAIKIPFSTIGCKKIPQKLRFNLARTVVLPHHESTVLTWISRQYYYNNAKQGGILNFSSATSAAALKKQSDFATGVVKLKVDVVSLPKSGFVNAFLGLYDLSGKLKAKASRQARFDSRNGELVLPEVSDGVYIMRFLLAACKGGVPAYYGGSAKKTTTNLKAPFMRMEWPVVVNNKARLDSTLKLLERGKRLNCQVRLIGQLSGAGNYSKVKCKFTLLTAQGKKITSLGEMPFPNKRAQLNCKLPNLPERSRFQLLVELLVKNKIIFSENLKFATPSKPAWLGNTEGKSPGKVPAPWVPVQLHNRTVKVWGRDYIFNKSPVPSQIISQGVSLLASPCELIMNPKITSWKLLSAKRESPAAVVFKWLGKSSKGFSIQAQTRVEFDGIVKVDVSVPANVKVSTFYLNIPYRKELAKFVHRGPVQFGGILTTYRLPDKLKNHHIRNNFFLLNDQVGLCWFDGMKFDWTLQEAGKAIQLQPKENKVNLRVNYIDKAKVFPIVRKFTFGLEAIPARPLPAKEPGLRKCYVYRYGFEDSTKHPAWFSTVDYIAEGNIRMERGTVEIWVKPDFAPETHRKKEVFFETSHGDKWKMLLKWEPQKGIIAEINERGRRTIVNSGVQLKSGEWTHVALTWGKCLALYVNGKLTKAVLRKGALKVFPVNIFAGGKKVFVDGLKISGIAKNKFDLSGPPQLDTNTLLLDNFESESWTNGRRSTIPDKIAVEAEAGYLSPDGNLTAGKWGKGVNSMKVPVKSMVEGLAALGMKDIQFHADQYTDEACAGLYIQNEKAFKKALKAIHKVGMRAIMYTNNSLSNRDRMWDAYADKWLITPHGTPFVKAGIPDEKTFQACPRSEYAEYFFWRLGKLIDKYGVDGFFLDGRMYSSCNNALHGCGVKNFEGKIVPERNVWDGRKKQLRMYKLIKQRNCYYEQHKSGNWDAPSCFLADCVWEGEQLMGLSLGSRKKLDILPLIAMRAQLNGIPYGVPSRYSAYAYAPFSPLDNCTYAFVHGTTWGMTYRIDEVLTLSPYWEALDNFGATYQGFRSYWSKTPPALATPDKMLKVSAYVKPGKALLIIANFNENKSYVQGEIKLDFKVLGLKNPKVTNAFSGKSISLKNGDLLPVKIKSFRQAWFLLEDQK